MYHGQGTGFFTGSQQRAVDDRTRSSVELADSFSTAHSHTRGTPLEGGTSFYMIYTLRVRFTDEIVETPHGVLNMCTSNLSAKQVI